MSYVDFIAKDTNKVLVSKTWPPSLPPPVIGGRVTARHEHRIIEGVVTGIEYELITEDNVLITVTVAVEPLESDELKVRPTDIDRMPAGIKMDMLIAEKVMGMEIVLP